MGDSCLTCKTMSAGKKRICRYPVPNVKLAASSVNRINGSYKFMPQYQGSLCTRMLACKYADIRSADPAVRYTDPDLSFLWLRNRHFADLYFFRRCIN